MEKEFNTIYGKVTVRNAMLEMNDNTTLCDGVEIKGDGFLIEILEWMDIDELTVDEVVDLIDNNF